MLKLKFDRIEGFMKFRGWNLKRFAKELDVSPALISRLKKGEIPASHNVIERTVLLTGANSIDELFFIEQERETTVV